MSWVPGSPQFQANEGSWSPPWPLTSCLQSLHRVWFPALPGTPPLMSTGSLDGSGHLRQLRFPRMCQMRTEPSCEVKWDSISTGMLLTCCPVQWHRSGSHAPYTLSCAAAQGWQPHPIHTRLRPGACLCSVQVDLLPDAAQPASAVPGLGHLPTCSHPLQRPLLPPHLSPGCW